MTYRDQPWHRECLVCTGCQTPLAGQQFTSREDDPYCVTCFGELFAPKCSSCKHPITGGSGGPKTEWVRCRWGGRGPGLGEAKGQDRPPDGSANPQPPSRTRWRQVCVLRRPPLAPQLLLLRPLLHLPGGSGLRARRRPSAVPGLQPGRALSQGSGTKAPSPDGLWDPASPRFGAPLGLQDSASPLQHPQSGTS